MIDKIASFIYALIVYFLLCLIITGAASLLNVSEFKVATGVFGAIVFSLIYKKASEL
jgi:hypothetical protein